MGVVVGSSATFREISTGRVLILLSGATNSLISFTWVCSMIGDRSVALITATLSGTSFLAPNYKTINRTSYNIIYTHLLSCTLSCLALVLEKLITPLNQKTRQNILLFYPGSTQTLVGYTCMGKGDWCWGWSLLNTAIKFMWDVEELAGIHSILFGAMMLL